MARRKRVILTCTAFLAVILLVRASEPAAASDTTEKQGSSLGVEMLHDDTHRLDKIEEGKKTFQQAMQLLDSSSVKVHERVFFRQKSSFARTFLSDELQKQKGLLPTALRLVTQGIVSLFKSTPTSTTAPPPSSSAKEDSQNTRDEQPGSAPVMKASHSKHRDPNVAKAMDLLELAGYEYENDDALWTLANIYFHGQYKARRDLGQAFDMYAALADRSANSTAQHMVGFLYSTGLGNVVERDEAKAMLYTTFAAWVNNSPAALTLGYKYMLGIGTKKSCKESELYYKRAADKAYEHFINGPPLGRTMPPAKVRLTDEDGGAYGAGASGPGAAQLQGQATDIKDYMDYSRYVAEHDNQEALRAKLQLGVIYYTGNAGTGTTVQRDYQKAGMYLKSVATSFFTPKMTTEAILKATEPKAAENAGNAAIAAAFLGKMYWRGEGFEVDEKQALDWFKKGSLLNNPVALNGLGMMYLKGAAGLTPNPTKAIEYFKKAADLKYSDAQVNIALIYAQDPKYYAAAFTYLLEAAQQQNFQAVYHLGEAYSHGLLGVAKNCEKASRYFKYVAERGDWEDTLFSDAYEAYQAGDVEYAAILYLLAAERGIEVGQSNFAWILDRELPTSHYLTKLTSPSRTAVDAISQSALVNLASPSRLLQMALVYWTRSANQGDVDARVKMGDYYFSGIGTEVDFGKATACYRVAAEADRSAMAMWNLGWMHENGVGVPKDFHLAKRWYDRSLSTNPGAVMPVTLSLVKWNARYIWSYLTGGDVGGSPGSFWSFGAKSSESDSSSASTSSERGTEEAAQRENNPSGGGGGDGTNDGNSGDRLTSGSESGTGSRSEWDPEEINRIGWEKWKNQRQTGPGQEDEFDETDPFQQQHHNRHQEEDEMEDDLVEGLVIIGLCMVVGYLMYVRQFRFGNQGQQPNQNNRDNNNPQQPQPPVEGLPGDPNAPGRFAYYAAGG